MQPGRSEACNFGGLMEITEQKLLKLTSTLLLDFCQCQILSRDFENMTVADLTNYCRGWIKQNVKEFNDPPANEWEYKLQRQRMINDTGPIESQDQVCWPTGDVLIRVEKKKDSENESK